MSENVAKWEIRQKFIDMVNRYVTEKNAANTSSWSGSQEIHVH